MLFFSISCDNEKPNSREVNGERLKTRPTADNHWHTPETHFLGEKIGHDGCVATEEARVSARHAATRGDSSVCPVTSPVHIAVKWEASSDVRGSTVHVTFDLMALSVKGKEQIRHI